MLHFNLMGICIFKTVHIARSFSLSLSSLQLVTVDINPKLTMFAI